MLIGLKPQLNVESNHYRIKSLISIYSTVQYSTVRCNAVIYFTVQYSTVHYSTVQYSTEYSNNSDHITQRNTQSLYNIITYIDIISIDYIDK